jgi:kinesin family protein 18/19
MIANISPSLLCIEDTINTLKYANRAKNIKVNIKKNIKDKNLHISKYDDVINALKSEVEYLKVQLDAKAFSPKSIIILI